MRAIDRVFTVQKIVSGLKEWASFDDVDVFFKALSISEPYVQQGESVDQRAYIRRYLKDCVDDVLMEIATQLNIPVPDNENRLRLSQDSKYWFVNHFRLFISHHHSAKESAGNLRKALHPYGISAFVAHDDIEPTEEWREELIRALMSMDALAAILTPEFRTSHWTDQEIGFASAQDKLVVPISKGVSPYGFVSKYQSLNAGKQSLKAVSAGVFRVLSTNSRTKGLQNI